ncbi:alpha/beta-hydrolase, partial [Exidia glandulosa HHB12029]
IQVLVHGITYNTAYWDSDFKPEIYSYARFASRKGYATLNLARLGYGLSDHPDPVNVVQYPLSAGIIIELIKLARSGSVPGASGRAFDKVVYVGHSAGSIIGNGLVQEAPNLIDAVALTGFSHSLSDLDLVTLFGIQPAALNDPARFGNLSSDYITTGNATNREISFYSAAGTFDPEALAYDEAHKDTSTTGEALTTGVLQGVAPAYTGHVLSIAGDGDIVFCPESDCANLEKEQEFYPNAASFETAVVPSTGHSLNFHKSAPVFYNMIQDWLNRRGL